jgi:type IV pilus assembly protein PilP
MIPMAQETRHMIRILMSLALCGAMLVSLPGCSTGQDFADLRKQLESIRQRPKGAIKPPPEFKPQPIFSYSAHKKRSPFLPPTDEMAIDFKETATVAPDLTRPREYLEQYNIEALKMVGTITRPGGPLEALISDSDGGVHRVKVGNYMGKNFGRVSVVEGTRIAVVEIVPDGHEGWVERPRTIRLDGQ